MLAARHAARRGGLKVALLAATTLVFWIGCFLLFTHVLRFFDTITAFGPVLTERLLIIVLVSFLAVLLMSNMVTALTTFYLAADVRLLLAAPVGARRLHQARFIETMVASSWMVLLFGLPIFLAYGAVYRPGPLYYLATVMVLIPFLVIPAALGVLVTTGLVLVFPARRAREALLVGSAALIALAYLLLRLIRPERLASPNELAGFAAFLAGFEAPASPFLPSTWAVEVLMPSLGQRAGEPLFYLGMLISTAAMAYVACALVVERVFLAAWSRAQEGRVRAAGERTLSRWLRNATAPAPHLPGLLFVKDCTIFFRDPTQWSQLLLLLALVVVYVYNFSVLPIDDGSALAATLRDVVAFANLGLAAFVTASVAVRFVYPAVSLEGRSWWVLRSAPVPLGAIWWSKFWIAFLPLALLGELLIVVTGRFLGTAPALTLVFMATLLLVIAAIVSMGLAFGAAYPRLDTHNAAQIATGFGGVVYMVACLGLIAAVIALELWPISRLFWNRFATAPIGTTDAGIIAGAFGGVVVLTVVACVLARRSALRSLARF